MLNCDDRILQSHQPVSIDNPDSSRAAVAMVLRRNSAHEEMLFIRRANSERDPWSGQIALPGGGWERDDASLLHTARRETHEEVGLALKPEECVGRLDDQPGQNRSRQLSLTISCYVFRLNRRQSLTLNSEVAEAFWVPLEVLLDRSRQRAYRAPACVRDGHGDRYRIARPDRHRRRANPADSIAVGADPPLCAATAGGLSAGLRRRKHGLIAAIPRQGRLPARAKPGNRRRLCPHQNRQSAR